MSEDLDDNTVPPYPHQVSDDVTAEDLAQHFGENPDMYHDGLHDPIHSMIGDLVLDEPDLGNTPETPPDDSSASVGKRANKSSSNKENSEKLVLLSVDLDDADRKSGVYDLRSKIERLAERDPSMFEEARRGSNVAYYHPEYIEYVGRLREIRRGQRQQIESQMAQLDPSASPEERRRAYIEATAFSPVLAARSLQTLGVPDDIFGMVETILTPEECSDAAASPELFGERLEQLIVTHPDALLCSTSLVRNFLNPDQIGRAIDRTLLINPHVFEGSFSVERVAYLLDDPRDKVEFVMKVCGAADLLASFVINNPDLREMIGNANVKLVLGRLIENGYPRIITSNFPEYIKEGLMTEEDVMFWMDSYLRANQDGLNAIYSLSNMLTKQTDEKRLSDATNERVRQNLVEILLSPDTSVYDLRTFLDNPQTPELRMVAIECIRVKLAKDPLGILESLIYSPDLRAEVLGDDEVRSIISDAINSASSENRLSANEQLVGFLVRLHCYSPEEIRQMLDSTMNSRMFFSGLGELNGSDIYSEPEIGEMFIRYFNELPPDLQCYHVENAIDYFSPEEIRVLFRSLTEDGHNIYVSASLSDRLGEIVGENELRQHPVRVMEAILSGKGDVLGASTAIEKIERNLGLTEARKYAERFLGFNPEEAMYIVQRQDRLFDPTLLEEYFNEQLLTDAGRARIIRGFGINSSTSRYLSQESLAEVFINPPIDSMHQVLLISNIEPLYLSHEQYVQMVNSYCRMNPAQAMQLLPGLQRKSPELTAERLFEIASEERGVGVIDKYLIETMKRASESRPTTRSALLGEAETVYSMLAHVEKYGGKEQLLKFIAAENSKGSQAIAYLDMFYASRSLNPELDFSSIGSSSDLRRTAYRSVIKACGKEISADQATDERLQELDQELRVLAVYLVNHSSSPEHRELVSVMLDRVVAGDYVDWRSGGVDTEALAETKSKGLLPKTLTIQQFNEWRSSETTRLSEVFSVDAEQAANEIKRVLIENAQHFNGALDDTRDVGVEMPDIGRRIEELNKTKQLLRKSEQDTVSEAQLAEVEEEVSMLRQGLVALQIIDDVRALSRVDADQVKSGRMLGQNGTKAKSIEQVIDRLRKNLGSGNAFVADQLGGALTSYYEQTGERRDISVSDVADFLTTMRIGVEPLGSCQNYRNGSMNEALLGYTDPNTKIIVIRNEKGSLIGRAIFRLLEDAEGKPGLHVDTIYSVDISDGVKRALYAHAVEKAEKMQMPVYTSQMSQNEGGGIVVSTEIKGVTATNVVDELASNGSRAPFVYVDASGGRQKNGVYKINRLKLLGLETPE